ncbi:MAG: ABC transporter substrate-binding protein [Gammaproteobacteria bacterium]|nr:ABC transporter substrate-binding protein [Gammaproteobacteria bacterium]
MTRFFALLVLLIPLISHADPQESIKAFQQALLENTSHDTPAFAERFEQLAPVVDATHDLHYIARITLGRYWAGFSAEEREIFATQFRRLAVANYAARFPQFNPEQFEIIEQKSQPRGVVLVRAQLHRPDDAALEFDYLLRDTDDGWRIVNILVNGVSDLALKRAEYAAILRDGSMADLLQTLDNQFERLRISSP